MSNSSRKIRGRRVFQVGLSFNKYPRGAKSTMNFKLAASPTEIRQMVHNDGMKYPPPLGHLCPIINESDNPSKIPRTSQKSSYSDESCGDSDGSSDSNDNSDGDIDENAAVLPRAKRGEGKRKIQ
jgi:hypothetical protein